MNKSWDLSLSLGNHFTPNCPTFFQLLVRVLLTVRLNNLHTFETWRIICTARIQQNKLSKGDRARPYSCQRDDSFNPIENICSLNESSPWSNHPNPFPKQYCPPVPGCEKKLRNLFNSNPVIRSAKPPAAGCEGGAASFPATLVRGAQNRGNQKQEERLLNFKHHLGVSKNNGTPKSSILIGFSIINHPFWGTPIFGNIHFWTPFSSPFGPSSTLAFSVPFITGLVLILDLKTHQWQPLNHLSAFKIWHLHGGFLLYITEIARAPPKWYPQKDFLRFWPNTLAGSYQFSSNLFTVFRAMPWGTTIQSFFEQVSLNMPCPQIRFCSTNIKYFFRIIF